MIHIAIMTQTYRTEHGGGARSARAARATRRAAARAPLTAPRCRRLAPEQRIPPRNCALLAEHHPILVPIADRQ